MWKAGNYRNGGVVRGEWSRWGRGMRLLASDLGFGGLSGKRGCFGGIELAALRQRARAECLRRRARGIGCREWWPSAWRICTATLTDGASGESRKW